MGFTGILNDVASQRLIQPGNKLIAYRAWYCSLRKTGLRSTVVSRAIPGFEHFVDFAFLCIDS